MVKRVIILVALTSILVLLLRFHTSSPVNHTSIKSNDTSKYSMVEYEIINIKGGQYYGKSENGNEIIFSAKTISSGEKIQNHDVVICYFDKNNPGQGIVKVEKK
jgi:hypothetical protein